MSEQAAAMQESVGYRRAAALPGVEVLAVHHSPREWRCVNPTFAISLLRSWHGAVTYRGAKRDFAPGQLICTQPGEPLIAMPHAGRAGSFYVIEFTPSLLDEYLAAHQARPEQAEWRDGANTMSQILAPKLRHLLATLTPEAPPLAPQSAAVELSSSLVTELMCGTVARPPAADARSFRAAARMRECLQHADFRLNLSTLAAAAGLSKFRALRAFKRRYGLTPHAYQVCVRTKRVAELLLAGSSPAEAAAACGFADQSHMNRHFKRLLGVTPKRYLCAHGKISEPSFDIERADAEIR